MTHFARLLIALAIGLVLAPARGGAQAQDAGGQPTFRSGVDLVALNVTVTAGGTRFVTDLTQQDFILFEDGAQQEIRYFTREQLPIALALLMDTSASMVDRMETAQEAAIGFARRLRPDDLAEVIDFDSRVDIRQTFTSDIEQLERAIRETSAGGSTSLYNALYISLRELRKAPLRVEDIRREAIVVLSDGEDTSSLMSFEEVLELAKRSETVIYTIGLRVDDDNHAGFRESDFVLRELAQETGGRSFFPDSVDDLKDVYQLISDELSSQYSLGYVSNNPLRNGRWRRIIVRVNDDGMQARTRQGYYGPRSSP